MFDGVGVYNKPAQFALDDCRESRPLAAPLWLMAPKTPGSKNDGYLEAPQLGNVHHLYFT